MAVLLLPIVLLISASSPRTVLPLLKQPSWQVPRACGESTKQDRANGMSSKTSRKGAGFIQCFSGRVVVIIIRGLCLFCYLHGKDEVLATAPCSALFRVLDAFLSQCLPS